MKKSEAEIHKIRAAVLRKRGGPFSMESLEMEGPRDDEVLVRVIASGICHTDISFCDYWSEADGPLTLGHEGAGIIEELGRKVQGLKVGDHVVLSYQSCGRCRYCRKGRPTECEHFYEANFGFRRLDGSNALSKSGIGGHFFGQSSFATYALATERNAVKVSKKLDLKLLAPLGCGLQTGAGTVMNSLKVAKGKSIGIFGTGAVGLAALMAARIVGANPIIGVDIVPTRLALALDLGATHVIDNRYEYIPAAINRITGGGVDYVVETTAEGEMHNLAVEILNPKGTVALLTGESGTTLPDGSRTIGIIQGDAVPQLFIPMLIAFYKRGKFPFDRLLKFYPFANINKAIADAKSGRTIKPVLRIGRM